MRTPFSAARLRLPSPHLPSRTGLEQHRATLSAASHKCQHAALPVSESGSMFAWHMHQELKREPAPTVAAQHTRARAAYPPPLPRQCSSRMRGQQSESRNMRPPPAQRLPCTAHSHSTSAAGLEADAPEDDGRCERRSGLGQLGRQHGGRAQRHAAHGAQALRRRIMQQRRQDRRHAACRRARRVAAWSRSAEERAEAEAAEHDKFCTLFHICGASCSSAQDYAASLAARPPEGAPAAQLGAGHAT